MSDGIQFNVNLIHSKKHCNVVERLKINKCKERGDCFQSQNRFHLPIAACEQDVRSKALVLVGLEALDEILRRPRRVHWPRGTCKYLFTCISKDSAHNANQYIRRFRTHSSMSISYDSVVHPWFSGPIVLFGIFVGLF